MDMLARWQGSAHCSVSCAEHVHHTYPLAIDLHQDANYLEEHGWTGAHAESPQFPSASAKHKAGKRGQSMYMQERVKECLQRCSWCICCLKHAVA